MPARLINIKYITIRAEKVASPVTALQAETIKLPFAFQTLVSPMNHVLREVQKTTDANMGRGNFEGETGKSL